MQSALPTSSSTPAAALGQKLGWWLVALVSCAQGCAHGQPWGEATNSQCSDGADNDGDLLIDCDDPDCRASSVCARQALWPKVSQDDKQGDAQSAISDSSAPDRLADAATKNDAAEPTSNDSGTPPLVDAGMSNDSAIPPGDPCSAVKCAETTICVDGGCASPAPTPISMKIRITSAIVPYLQPTGALFDTTPSGTYPDPYVVIIVNGNEVFRTSTVTDSITPMWNEPGVRLDITSNDEVEFKVSDDDSTVFGNTDGDDLMYTCTPTLPETQPTASIDLMCVPSNALLGGVMGFIEPAN